MECTAEFGGKFRHGRGSCGSIGCGEDSLDQRGRDDHTVSYDAAQAYVAQVRAPVKAFIPIDGGHFACFTDPTEFLAAMRAHVMPLIAKDAR